jgi:hypothetical protein
MVDRELYEAYSRALATLSDAAEAELRRALAEYETLERDRDYVAAAALYHRIVGRFGRVASEVAREFYQRQRDASDLDSDYVAQQAPEIPGGFCAQDATEARAMSSAAAEWLVGKGSRRVMENADFTIGYNARRDPAHPMWAIVPGPLACGFCLMVASNGWYMHSKPVDAKRHPHCKCTVVADFDTDEPSLEGYDPDALQKLYSDAASNVESDARAEWDRMRPEEKARYKRHGTVSEDRYVTTRVAAEIDRMTQNPAKRSWKKAVESVGSRRVVETQLQHFDGTPAFDNTRKQRGRTPSYFAVPYGMKSEELASFAKRIIEATAGTGKPLISDSGKWDGKEVVELPDWCEAYDGDTGERVHLGKIHYGTRKQTMHIVPMREGRRGHD